MKIQWIALLCLLAALGCRSEESSKSKGFERQTVTGDTAQQGRRFAVCIGVSTYDKLPDLRYAHRDAEDVYDFLISREGGYELDNCVLLCDSNAPDGQVLKQQMESLFTTWMARVRPQDTVFIYFSGHGLPFGRNRAFMAAWDTDPDDIYPTAIPMDRIQEYLDQLIAARNVVIVLDTCFSGAVNSKSYLPLGQRQASFDEGALDRLAEGRGRVILTASTGQQAAHELTELEHGIFTYCFLEGIEGKANTDHDDRITLTEIWSYLQREVPRTAGRFGLRQEPVRRGSETGEMILAMARAVEPPPKIDESRSNEALLAMVEGTQLMQLGFYSRATEKYEQALPYLPLEERNKLESLIDECRLLEERKQEKPRPADPRVQELNGTLAEADFQNGRTAEDQGLWNLAVSFYAAALKSSPEELRPMVRERLDHCRTEERLQAVYMEAETLFNEAEVNPSRTAYAASLEKLNTLPEDYRHVSRMIARCLEEDTSDESRKYFTFGVRSQEAKLWHDSIQWFERAKDGAGGRYPEAIERHLGFCRVSLSQAIRENARDARLALTEERYEICVDHCDAWLVCEPGSGEALELRLKAAQAHARQLFGKGRFAECAAFSRRSLGVHPDDKVLENLAERARQEDIPPAARAVWDRVLAAEERGDWSAVVQNLNLVINVLHDDGFNRYYRNLARTLLEQSKNRAYQQFSHEAQEALQAGDAVTALRKFQEAENYRPDFPPLSQLIAEVEKQAKAEEEALYQSALEQEKMESLQAMDLALDASEISSVLRASAGYETYLERFPHGKWADEARQSLVRLDAKRKGFPEVAGFTFLKAEHFSCGGVSNLVPIYRHEKSGMEFVLIPGGSFTMGSPPYEEGRHKNEPAPHTVRVKPFLLCRTECTKAGWEAVLGKTLQGYDVADPQTGISWDDCVQWCRKAGVRLPTEVEWEFACRGGTTTRFCGGNTVEELNDYAWFNGTARDRLHPVARKRPNAFGLYDMHGNVWEWCQDRYLGADPEDSRDAGPVIKLKVLRHVNRGGGYNFSADECRSAKRSGDLAGKGSGVLGFRPALSLQ